MKVIKFRLKEKFKYKRKVIIKNLILNIFIGIHNFEKKKKQRVRFNIEVVTDPYIKPNNKDLTKIGRAHVRTPVTSLSRMPSSA